MSPSAATQALTDLEPALACCRCCSPADWTPCSAAANHPLASAGRIPLAALGEARWVLLTPWPTTADSASK